MSKTARLLVEPAPKPRVLILGDSSLSPTLSLELIKQDCDVMVTNDLPPISRLFDYIFLFSQFEELEKVQKSYLKSRGRILLIETDRHLLPDISPSTYQRVVKLGDTSAWDTKEAVALIKKSMFQRSTPTLTNFKKELNKNIETLVSQEDIVLRIENDEIIAKRIEAFSSIEKEFETESEEPEKTAISTPVEIEEQETAPLDVYVENHSWMGSGILKKIVGLILVVVISLAAGIFLLYKTIDNSYNSVKKSYDTADIRSLQNELPVLEKKLSFANTLFDWGTGAVFFIKDTKQLSDVRTTLSVSQNFVRQVNKALPYLTLIKNEMLKANTSNTTYDEEKILSILHESRVSVDAGRVQLEKVSLPYIPTSDIVKLMTSYSSTLESVENTAPVAHLYLNQKGKKRFLVLFQNNFEIRPTGGFIGSYGILTLDNGKFVSLSISDIYTADGQLKGHVDPPLPIRTYLAQPNWFMRDSNWDPDFALSADRALWFMEKETGEKADAVIGLNLFVIQSILKSTGPVTLPDFGNEKVTADNFFEKAQGYAQSKFFPGSTGKKDFLTAVANALFIRLTEDTKLPFPSLTSALYTSLEEKNILIYDKDPEYQKFFEDRGWAGRMTSVVCASEEEVFGKKMSTTSCIPDYLSINEANLGINKINQYINKSVTIAKKIDSKNILHTTLVVSYENTQPDTSSQASTYINYLRIFIPRSSQFESLSLNGSVISTKDIQIENYLGDKTSIGYLLKLAGGNKANIKITYSLLSPLPQNTFSYQFLFQKQSGEKSSPFIFSLAYPETGLNLEASNFKNSSGIQKEIYYTTDTSVDRILALSVK